MHPQFSEFSYGFGLSHELVSRFTARLVAAPELPSLIKEGSEGGGYDVLLPFRGWPVFLQFKLCERIARSSGLQWELFASPYYRFWLHAPARSRQHDLLLDLEADEEIVYYAAPSFHTIDELNRAFLQRAIVSGSIFVAPSAIGPLPDSEAHCIAFRPSDTFGYRCSDPRRITLQAGDALLETLASRAQALEPGVIDTAYLSKLAEKLTGIVVRSLEGAFAIEAWLTARPPLERALFLTRTFLGCDLLFLREAVQ